MTTQKALFFALPAMLAWTLDAGGGWAQDVPAADDDGLAGVQALIDFRVIRLPPQITERRYRVEALRFKARDESGVDWWGSDEVMVEVADSEGATVSEEIEDIDSGDTHEFVPLSRSCIVSVVPGEVVLEKTSYCDIDDIGDPAPVSFHVEMWEKDVVGFPTGFCVVLSGLPGHWPAHCVNDGNGDDLIGHAQVDFTAQELEAAMPNVGDQLVETVVLHPCEGDTICAGDFFIWDLPDYSFTYRVTRVPDGRGFPRLELAESMRRTGARTQLEAVLAGLRALEEPEPRRVLVEEESAPPAAN